MRAAEVKKAAAATAQTTPQDAAFVQLEAYLQKQGGTLSSDWACQVNKAGVEEGDTLGFFISPVGRRFRTFAGVARSLGLLPHQAAAAAGDAPGYSARQVFLNTNRNWRWRRPRSRNTALSA